MNTRCIIMIVVTVALTLAMVTNALGQDKKMRITISVSQDGKIGVDRFVSGTWKLRQPFSIESAKNIRPISPYGLSLHEILSRHKNYPNVTLKGGTSATLVVLSSSPDCLLCCLGFDCYDDPEGCYPH